jgi:pyridoxal phosphate enzyme (YggS family)
MSNSLEKISENVNKILSNLPSGVTVLAAAKGRTVSEIEAAISAGIAHIGHNYVQEAATMLKGIDPAERKMTTWHMIGHLQRNKTRPALECFDVIDTLDSLALAAEIEQRCQGKMVPILVEVNSALELNKSGIYPENVPSLLESLKVYPHIQVIGLMTMGPQRDYPEELRPYFRLTRQVFEEAARQYQPSFHILSMGMSDSYRIAIEEGATMIRIGTLLFGPRPVREKSHG